MTYRRGADFAGCFAFGQSKTTNKKFGGKTFLITKIGVFARKGEQTFEKGPVDVFQKFRSTATSIAVRLSAGRANPSIFLLFSVFSTQKIRTNNTLAGCLEPHSNLFYKEI